MTVYNHKEDISHHHLIEIVGSFDFPLGIDAVFSVEYILTYLPVLGAEHDPSVLGGPAWALLPIPVQL